MSFKLTYVPAQEGTKSFMIIRQDGYEDKHYSLDEVKMILRAYPEGDERREAMEAALRMFERKEKNEPQLPSMP